MTLGIKRFIRYAVVGVSTLLIDLGLLYIATAIFHIPYYLSTAFSFFIAININYFISRAHIFKKSERKIHHGYVYFLGIAVCGAIATTGLVVVLVTYLKLYFLIARVLVAGVVGIANYLINLYFNFKVAGKH
jgi:putative flippase GtrA